MISVKIFGFVCQLCLKFTVPKVGLARRFTFLVGFSCFVCGFLCQSCLRSQLILNCRGTPAIKDLTPAIKDSSVELRSELCESVSHFKSCDLHISQPWLHILFVGIVWTQQTEMIFQILMIQKTLVLKKISSNPIRPGPTKLLSHVSCRLSDPLKLRSPTSTSFHTSLLAAWLTQLVSIVQRHYH